MGVRFPSVFTNTFIGPLPANATETVLCTTPLLTPSLDGAPIFLQWFCTILAGASVTGHTFRIRRGTTSGGVFVGAGSWVDVAAAGVQRNHSGNYNDLPGAISGQQYSLTLVQTAATGAGTLTDVYMLAFSL